MSDVWKGDVHATYMHSSGVHEYTATTKGAEIKMTYTDNRSAAALVLRLEDVIVWLESAIADGTATRTEVDGFWNGDEMLDIS